MKINLTQVTLKPTIAGPEVTKDLTKDIAEAIYQRSRSLGETSFALKLYNATGPVDVSAEEAGYIKAALGVFLYWVQKPVLELLGE